MYLQAILFVLAVTVIRAPLLHPSSRYLGEYGIIPAEDGALCKATQNTSHSSGIELLLTVPRVPVFSYMSQVCWWKCQNFMQSSIKRLATTYMIYITWCTQHKCSLLPEQSSTSVNAVGGCKDISLAINCLIFHFIRKLLECFHGKFTRKNNIGFSETMFWVFTLFALILPACGNAQAYHLPWQHAKLEKKLKKNVHI